jgi:hypothetical protein
MKLQIQSVSLRCAVAAALVAAVSGQAHALSLTLTDTSSRSVVDTLNFYSNAAGSTITTSESNVYVGSYKLSTGDWAFCLSPLTAAASPGNYTQVSLTSFMTSGTGYSAVFSGYGAVGPGYAAQNVNTVLTKIQTLFNYAYADSTLTAAKSAAFAFALWEIEGETVSPYSTTTGGLRTTDASLGYYLNALNGTATWASLGLNTITNYNFSVYQADPIASSQSFLTVTPASGGKNTGADAPIPEPATPLLMVACALAWAGSVRVVNRRKAEAAV